MTGLLAGIHVSATATDLTYANYPQKPITIVVPFGTGSESDHYVRLMVDVLKTYIRKAEFVVLDTPGDSGAIAAERFKTASPDGYTLMAGRVASLAIAPACNPSLPYRWGDFTFLGLLEIEPLVCGTRANSSFRDVHTLLQAIRQSPGKYKFAHSGTGTLLNVAPQYLMKLAGLKPKSAVGIGYATSAEVAEAVANGEADFMCNNAGSFFEPLQAGKVYPFFSTASGRIPELPNLKNAREAGFPNLSNLFGWTVLLGPPGMPAPLVARWKKALSDVSHDAKWKFELEQRGATQTLGSTKDNEYFMRDQFVFYDHLVLTLGIRQ